MLSTINFNPSLSHTFYEVLELSIPEERQLVLQDLISCLQNKLDNQEPLFLNCVCTHNSRRSQFSQVWSKTAADYYGVPCETFSSGVEVTAFNYRAVDSLKRQGFEVTVVEEGENPVYSVSHSKGSEPQKCFSKLYTDASIPQKGGVAIMTCSHADNNCPVIPSADARIPVRFEDPKAFDDTDKEKEMYDARSLQIASEMFYVFRNLKC